jgi:hypothetical protein
MVQNVVRERILQALGHLLEPVVLLLLKNGISWNEFLEIARAKFVDVATRRFGIRGRPTNISRVAILTGQDRREVSRLRRQFAKPMQPRAVCKPTQVLDGWHRDEDFLDAAGRPRDLKIDGEQATFEALVRRHAPSIPHVAMLKQLRLVGAVQDLPDDKVRVLKRAYVPKALSEDHIALWGSVLHDIGTTWEYNLMREPSQRSRFERRAVNLKVGVDTLPAFREFLEVEGQAFLERIDDWLSAHEVPESAAASGTTMRLGVGVYQLGDERVVARRSKK